MTQAERFIPFDDAESKARQLAHETGRPHGITSNPEETHPYTYKPVDVSRMLEVEEELYQNIRPQAKQTVYIGG